MGKKKTDKLVEECAAQLKAISNPIRLQIILNLRGTSSSVKGLMRHIPIEQNLMSHHLKKLRKAGLVTRRRDGKGALYALTPTTQLDGNDCLDLGCCKLCLPAKTGE